MIRLPQINLPEDTQRMLDELQQRVNTTAGYDHRVAAGKKLFRAVAASSAFLPVRRALAVMCSGARRCCYCEDSAATDIEHIRPKDFYPHLLFIWDNYLYGCPRCNRPKSNICDIYSHVDGRRISVSRAVRQHGGPPEEGDPLLINPRQEDPLEYMTLDLRDTLYFLPRGQRDSRNWERALHTIALLKLNEEDVLPMARAEAYENYVDRLEKYIDLKRKRKPLADLQKIIKSIRRMGHPTVWQEMKRQATHYPNLAELFIEAPEALTW